MQQFDSEKQDEDFYALMATISKLPSVTYTHMNIARAHICRFCCANE